MHNLFLREVSIDWDAVSDYTQHIAALHSFDRLIFQKQITFFTGENGSGKSTLLEAIAVAYGLIRRVVPKTTAFIQRIRIPPCTRGFI